MPWLRRAFSVWAFELEANATALAVNSLNQQFTAPPACELIHEMQAQANVSALAAIDCHRLEFRDGAQIRVAIISHDAQSMPMSGRDSRAVCL